MNFLYTGFEFSSYRLVGQALIIIIYKQIGCEVITVKCLETVLTAGSFLVLSVNAYAGCKEHFNDCKRDSHNR